MGLRLGWGRAALVAAATLLTTTNVHAFHDWNGFHWARSANPFLVKLGDNVSSTWDSYLATAASDWGASSVLNTQIVRGQTRPKSCRPSAGTVQVCNAFYGNNGWLGIAQVWIDGVHITQAITKVNDTYHSAAPYNSSAWKNFVMCQEVGHTLGLDHQDENFYNANLGSCMDYTNNPASNQHPDAHDYAELEDIYAHLDGSAMPAADASPAMNAEVLEGLEGPDNWGRLTHQGPGGRNERYELDLGNGKKVITHVIWASMFDQ